MKQKNRYSEEFKRDTLQLLQKSGKSRYALERELGLSSGLLRQWSLRYQVNPHNQELESSEVEKMRLISYIKLRNSFYSFF